MNIPRELYPFESHWLSRGPNLRLHYLDEYTDKSADPVVMLHGNPTWSIYYRNLALALRDQYRCVVPDHIGCGFSDKPNDDPAVNGGTAAYDYTLKSRVDDVEALLDSLNITRNVTLVLHDWGGMIGMAWADRHPERVARIVAMNTAAFRMPQAKKLPIALHLGRDTGIGAGLIRGFNAFARGAAMVGCKRHPMSKQLRDAFCAPYDTWDNRIATLRFVQDIPLEPADKAYAIVKGVEDRLGQFRQKPMMLCWGEKDFVFDHTFLHEWVRQFPKAAVHNFPDCGHYILEDASDEIIPLVKEFLAANPIG